MELQKTKTFAIVDKNFVRVTSTNQVIDFANQSVRLEIFVDDRQVPKYTPYCLNLIDINQPNSKVLQFPTNNENMFIVAYSEDDNVDLDTLLISGHL